MFKRIIHTFAILVIIVTNLILPLTTYAGADFEISNDFTMKYDNGDDFVKVTDETTYSVKNDKYFLPSGIQQTYYLIDYSKIDIKKEREFKRKSLKITDQNDSPISYKAKEISDGIQITVTIPRKVTSFDDLTISITYNTHDLINKSGNIVNMYVPALPKDTPLQAKESFNLTSVYKYSTKIITQKNLELPSYTQPSKIHYEDDTEQRTYSINVEDRIGKVSWLQFGTSQFYKFKIEQEAKKTDFITPTQISDIAPVVSTNIYKLAIPREDDENSQETLISQMTPQPTKVQRDKDGNLIATFEVPANKDSKIIIEGLISLSKKNIKDKKDIPNFKLTEYKDRITDFPDLATYTQADKYWETEDPKVKDIADKLLKKSNTIQELVLNDYEYIISNFNYSLDKLSNGNIRLGAKAALTGSQAICMEYSDSMTALLRAQGIPSRIAIGYGNDPHSVENNISSSKMVKQLIGHQWTQVWIPDYGWMSVDPTWGESNRRYIGSDLDHILWYTSSSSKQNITDVIFYSAEQDAIGEYSVYLQALEESDFKIEAKEAKTLDLALIKIQSDELPIDLYIKASLGGRILVYLFPIIVTIAVSSIITSVIYYFKRKNK